VTKQNAGSVTFQSWATTKIRQAHSFQPALVVSIPNFPAISAFEKQKKLSLVLVAHACNPSYSGRRGQEDCGSKPAWGNSS
jgi:hypothetical protein